MEAFFTSGFKLVFQLQPVPFISVSILLLHVSVDLLEHLFQCVTHFIALIPVQCSFIPDRCPWYPQHLRFNPMMMSPCSSFLYLFVTEQIFAPYFQNPSSLHLLSARLFSGLPCFCHIFSIISINLELLLYN